MRTAILNDSRYVSGCRYCGQEVEYASSQAGRRLAFDRPVHLLPQQISLLAPQDLPPVVYVVSTPHRLTCPVLVRNRKVSRRKP
jgi:hypothetical protein